MLSGRSTWLLFADDEIGDVDAACVLRECCVRLGLPLRGTEQLIHGSDVVEATTVVADFPGLQPVGQVSHYQLTV
eukprot:4474842-Amphidinium_carterae.1